MFNSNVFDYINILDKAADASWMRQEALSNNISNVSTPNYKRQDVVFEAELKKALGNCPTKDLDSRVSAVNNRLYKLKPYSYTDMSNYSYRLDQNNVDIENENVMLAANQLKYQGLVASLNQEFINLQTVMK